MRRFNHLLTLANDDRAIGQRFGDCPLWCLNPRQLALLRSAPLTNDQAESARDLIAGGLLRETAGQLLPTVPIYEQLSVPAWVPELVSQSAAQLQPLVAQLAADWRRASESPTWDEIAHSCLIGLLLLGVGGRLLLRVTGEAALGLLVTDHSSFRGVTLGFTRVRADLGLSCLVGRSYPGSADIVGQLRQRDVVLSLASLDAEGTVIFYGNRTAGLLESLAAYRPISQGPWVPPKYQLQFPELAAAVLNQLQSTTHLISRGVHLLVRETCQRVSRERLLPLGPAVRPGDYAFACYLQLVGELAERWVAQEVLPPVVTIDSIETPPAPVVALQGDMLKGLGR